MASGIDLSTRKDAAKSDAGKNIDVVRLSDYVKLWAVRTGSKAEPVAMMALPFVHRIASSGVHSTFDVGLLSAKIIG